MAAAQLRSTTRDPKLLAINGIAALLCVILFGIFHDPLALDLGSSSVIALVLLIPLIPLMASHIHVVAFSGQPKAKQALAYTFFIMAAFWVTAAAIGFALFAWTLLIVVIFYGPATVVLLAAASYWVLWPVVASFTDPPVALSPADRGRVFRYGAVAGLAASLLVGGMAWQVKQAKLPPRKAKGDRVSVGQGFLTSRLVYTGDFKNHLPKEVPAENGWMDRSAQPRDGIQKIRIGHFSDPAILEVALLGKSDGVLLDAESLALRASFHLVPSKSKPSEDAKVFSGGEVLSDEGIAGFLATGGSPKAAFLESPEGALWTPADFNGVLAWGELLGDGQRYYARLAGGILKVFDMRGRELWHKATDGQVMAVLPPSPDGPGVVESRYFDEVTLWDAKGKRIKIIPLRNQLSDARPCAWPAGRSILAFGSYTFFCFYDLAAKEILQSNIDMPTSFIGVDERRFSTVALKLDPQAGPYLALLAPGSQRAESVLRVFSPDGRVVYQELLGNSLGLGVLPAAGGAESLLVSEDLGQLWRYDLAGPK